MHRETEEAELDHILNETFTSTDYYDEEIGHLLRPNQPLPSQRKNSIGSNHSQSRSREESDDSDPLHHAYRQQFNSEDEQINRKAFSSDSRSDSNQTFKDQQPIQDHFYEPLKPFETLRREEEQMKKKVDMANIKLKYPEFMISQPSYKMDKAHEERIFKYNTLLQINIQAMDLDYCTISDEFRIAMGTDDSRVAIFDHTYTRPVNIFQAFPAGRRVMAIRWSPNLQFLAVSSDLCELRIYQFKQSIQIQDKTILRMKKQPIELFSLTAKELRSPILRIQFIGESPFMCLLVDQQDEMYVLEYKKHILNFRPFLSQLPLKFNNVFQLASLDFKTGRQSGTLLAVSSQQYVTICLLKPSFEVIMVYDKDKHGKNIPKHGYAHVCFRSNPLGLLIVWDKFAHFLNIEVQSLNPLSTRLSSGGMQLMPESTLLSGLLSSTLVYHLSQSGLKIYPTGAFGPEKDLSLFRNCIYENPINFFELPSGLKIQEELLKSIPSLPTLHLLSGLLMSRKGWLFMTSNTSLWSVQIQKFEDYIRNTIEHLNNWKVGLQLLYDGYLKKYSNYDNMTEEVINSLLHEYSVKYLGFLQVVIGKELDQNNSNLWVQEITFLFNILIETNNIVFMLDGLLPKLKALNLGPLINHLAPFIELKKLPILTEIGLRCLIQFLENRQVISFLLVNLQVELNQQDLPHTINSLLLEKQYYLEMILVNNLFRDFYTPFAVLVGKYLQSNKLQEIQTQKKLSSLISYSCFKVIQEINEQNSNQLNLTQSERKKFILKYREFLEIFLPLFQASIIPILLEHQEQALFQFIIPELFSGRCLQLINDISNKMLNADLMTSIALNIPSAQVQDTTAYWRCILTLFNKSIVKIDVFMGLKYLSEQAGQEQLLQNTVEASYQKIQKELQNLSRETIQNFFNSLLDSDHILLIQITGKVLGAGRFIEVIHAIMASPKHRASLLYPFLKQVMNRMQGKQLQKLKNIITQNLELFIELGSDELCELTLAHYMPDLGKFLFRPQINEYLMIQFVEKMLQKLSKIDFHQPSYHQFDPCSEFMIRLRLRFLELLAMTGRQHEVIEEVRKENYPLDQSLTICRKFGVIDAEAYLLVKSGGEGEVSSAIKLYFQLITQRVSLIDGDKIADFQDYLLSIISECINVCEHLTTSSSHFNNEWFLIAHESKMLKERVYEKTAAYIGDQLCDIIDLQVYPLLSYRLVKKGEIETIVEALEEEIHQLELQFLRVLLHEILKNHAFQKVMFLLTQETFIEWELKQREEIVQSTSKGFRSNHQCNICGGHDGVLIFYNLCGHQIHPFCGQDVKNCFLCLGNSGRLVEKQLDGLRKVKAEVYGKINEEIDEMEEQRKTFLQKMRKFEESIAEDLENIF